MKIKYLTIFLTICILIIAMPSLAVAKESPVGISAHYAHPVTGKIEDAGNNSAIGQGMAESVLDPRGIYERTDSEAWVTVTLHMARNLGKVGFAVQRRNDSSFYNADAREVSRSGDIIKYKLKVLGPDNIIRVEAEVKEMGRAVIFYGLMDGKVNLQDQGIGKENVAPKQTGRILKNTGEAGKNPGVGASSEKLPDTTGTVAEGPSALSPENASGNELNISLDNGEYGLLTKDSPELAELTGYSKEEKAWGFITKTFVIGIVICLCLMSCLSVFFGIFLKIAVKNLRIFNDLKEAELYDAEKDS